MVLLEVCGTLSSAGLIQSSGMVAAIHFCSHWYVPFQLFKCCSLSFPFTNCWLNRLGRLRCLVDGRTPEGSRRPGDPAYRWSQHIATLQDATTSATTTITKACHSATMTMGPALALSSRIAFRPKVLSVASRLLGVYRVAYILSRLLIHNGRPCGSEKDQVGVVFYSFR